MKDGDDLFDHYHHHMLDEIQCLQTSLGGYHTTSGKTMLVW
jgi:hypothetical protein